MDMCRQADGVLVAAGRSGAKQSARWQCALLPAACAAERPGELCRLLHAASVCCLGTARIPAHLRGSRECAHGGTSLNKRKPGSPSTCPACPPASCPFRLALQFTEAKILSEFIKTDAHKLAVAARPPMAVTNAVSWRQEGLFYKKNEVGWAPAGAPALAAQ